MYNLKKEEYTEYKTAYEEKLRICEQKLTEPQESTVNPWLTRLASLQSPTTLNRELVTTLIDEIVIHSPTRIQINFKFSDALAETKAALDSAGT